MLKPVILSPKNIERELSNLPGWEFLGNKISKQYKFKDFMDSLSFINQLAPFFENNDHHPDITINYSQVRFDLQRFDIGGQVTDLDIKTAHQIEDAYQKRATVADVGRETAF